MSANQLTNPSRGSFKQVLLLLLFAPILFTSCKSESKAEAANSVGEAEFYNEAHRPQFHFSPKENWMNDPNGMFYLEGKYHMFFQYYPDSTVWGPMHWGHATTTDLVHWEEQPIALYPDSLGYIFSGSAVVDEKNTSGFGNDTLAPIVAIFTYHNPVTLDAGRKDFQSQGLAYSLDKGKTWIKYSGNPVLQNNTGIQDFRDPKVIWHEASQKWIMALAVYDRVHLYGSPNLKDWQFLSDFGIPGDTRLWECPDLFPIRVAGTRDEKWVLLVSIQKEGPTGGTGTSYFVGDFDGETFKSDASRQQWLDWGADNYAFVTWGNAPLGSSRRLGIGWMSNWQYSQQVPTHPWRSAMTVPRILELHAQDQTYFLKALPVPAVESLRDSGQQLPTIISGRVDISRLMNPGLGELDLDIDLEATTATEFGVTLSNAKGEEVNIRIIPAADSILLDRSKSGPNNFSDVFFEGPHAAPLPRDGSTLDLRILFDRASLELFAAEDRLAMTEIYFPSEPFSQIEIWTKDGELALSGGKAFSLSSAW